MKHCLFPFIFLCLVSCGKQEVNPSVAAKTDNSFAEARKIMQTDPVKAESLVLEGLHLARENEYQKGIGDGLFVMGACKSFQGQYGDASEYYIKSLRLRQSMDDQKGMAQVYNGLGVTYYNCLAYENAEEALVKGQKAAASVEDFEGSAKIERSLGLLYQNQKQYERAESHYQMSLFLFEKIASPHVGSVYNDLAVISALMLDPDYEKVIKISQKALEAKRSKGISGTGLILLNIARAYFKLGDIEKTSLYIQQAKEASLNRPFDTISSLNEEAELYLHLGQIESAKQALEQAQALIPLLTGVEKEQVKETYKLAQKAYKGLPLAENFKEKQIRLGKELEVIYNSISAQQYKEQSKIYKAENTSLKSLVDQLETANTRLYIAMGFSIVFLLCTVYFLRQYWKISKLFRKYIVYRDDVLLDFEHNLKGS